MERLLLFPWKVAVKLFLPEPKALLTPAPKNARTGRTEVSKNPRWQYHFIAKNQISRLLKKIKRIANRS